MSFVVNLKNIVYEESRYTFKGVTQCACFVQQTTGAPKTRFWRAGKKVKDLKATEIRPGTAIATFDANGLYPETDPPGRHAAIYVKHDHKGITVIDQWEDKPTPAQRVLSYDGVAVDDWPNNGDYFYVVEIADGPPRGCRLTW